MSSSLEPVRWDARAAHAWVAAPAAGDDKYSRGVVTVIAGSSHYPGAAVLTVEAAARTGVGMVRYIGPAEPTRLVLERRPETVVVAGQSQAFVIGSGIDPASVAPEQVAEIERAATSGAPVVLDAGMLGRASNITGPCVITPHARECARLLASVGIEVDDATIARKPQEWVERAADALVVTTLLKGAVTHIATPADERGARFHAVVPSNTHWMASAGTGDVLAGILGALVATHAQRILAEPDALGPIAATAALIHATAGEKASGGGPVVALDVAQQIPSIVAGLL